MVRFKINSATKCMLLFHNRRIQATIAVLANARMGKQCTSPVGLIHDSGVVVNGKEIVIKDNFIADRTTEDHPIRVDTTEEWATIEALHNAIQIAKKDPANLYDPPNSIYESKPLDFN